MVNTITQLTEKNKELENNKNTEIKKYEYSLKRSLIKRTPEEHLIRENEILSKTVLEILLRFSKKQFSGSQKTDEEITELLSQPDWREKAQFEVGDYQCKEEGEVSECIGHFISCPWLISSREPIEIIENLKKDNEEAITHLTDYHFEQSKEKDTEINKLKKELEEKELRIKKLESKVEKVKEEASCHFAAVKKCEDWYTKNPGCLKEKLEDKTELLEKTRNRLTEEISKNAKLQEESTENLEIIRRNNKRFQDEKREREELERQLYLANKTLPTLPKKQSKFQKLGTKIKNGLQQLVRKEKYQKQELVARIEVKVN